MQVRMMTKWICLNGFAYFQQADIHVTIFENGHHLSANNIRENFKRIKEQFAMNENAKLVNYECVPIKLYNY